MADMAVVQHNNEPVLVTLTKVGDHPEGLPVTAYTFDMPVPEEDMEQIGVELIEKLKAVAVLAGQDLPEDFDAAEFIAEHLPTSAEIGHIVLCWN